MTDNIAKEIISQCLDIDIAEINDGSNMNNIIAWDSLNHIKIVMEIEERLNRNLETEEIIEIFDIESINKLFT
jgi:acyl carrier protein|tara:strand:+ start:785 stop:1003 length:219 start_codon:yes stop_codon:yes gene_type:complete